MDLSNQEARDGGSAKVHHAQFVKFVVVDRDVG